MSKIRELLYEGKFHAARQIVEDHEKKDNITSTDLLECQLLKSQLLLKTGNYEKGLILAEKVLAENQRLKKGIKVIDCFITVAEALENLGKFNESLQAINEAENLLRDLPDRQSEAVAEREGSILYWRGRLFWRKGDLNSAMELIEQSLAIRKEIGNPQEIAHALAFIGICYSQKGEPFRALEYYQQSLTLREEIGNNQDIAASLNSIGSVYHQKGDLDQALDYYRQSLALREHVGNRNDTARSQNNIGLVYWQKGQLDLALHFYKLSLALREQIGNFQEVSMSLNNIGLIFRDKGDLDQALDYYQRSLALDREIGNKGNIALSLSNIGEILAQKGQFNQALENLKQSLALRESLGNLQEVAHSYHNVGKIYHNKGEVDLALEYYQQALKLRENIGNRLHIVVSLINVASIYYQKGELDQAMAQLAQSLEICEELGNNLHTSVALFELVSVAIDQGSHDQAEWHLEYLRQINDLEKNTLIAQRYHVAQALLLKTSNRPRDRGKAEELLERVAKEKIIDHQLTVVAILSLCDLLLGELQVASDPGMLKEVKTHVTRLFEIAIEQHSHWLLAETHVLQSKLALVELDVTGARRFLTRAQHLAEEWGMTRLAIRVSNDHDALLVQLDRWDDLIARNASLQERLELVGLERSFGRIIRNRAIEIPKIPTEEPVMVLILTENGICLFSRLFLPQPQVEDQLVGAFLTAITRLGSSLFESSETIDRIIYQEHTIAVKPLDSMVFCYAYKGQSYTALRKLGEFMNSVCSSALAWSALKRILKSSQTLSSAEKNEIERLLDGIFLESDLTN